MRTIEEIRATCGGSPPADLRAGALIHEFGRRYGRRNAQSVIAGVFRAAAGVEEWRMARSLAKQVRGLGEAGALELLGRIGLLLADGSISPEVPDA